MKAIAPPTLRSYQSDAIDNVFAEIAIGHRRVLLVAPTGSGKTVMFAEIARRFHARSKRVLVVAHRKELIEQAARKLHASGVDRVGIWRGKSRFSQIDAMCVVASIQALKPGLLEADLVILDEAHHAPAASYTRLLDLYPRAIHLGVTATPWWGEGEGLGDYFETAVTATTVRALTEAGYLARVRMFTHPHTLRDMDLRGVKTSQGDWQPSALSARVNRPTLVGDIIEHWKQHAHGTQTLCFAASVEHSIHIVKLFRAAGITAEHIDGDTPEDLREAILARLESGETQVVSNYSIFTEGFDAPSVGCVILARPTLRPKVYLQSVGRGMRVEDGKSSVVVLDHAGACILHGLPDEDRPVTLTGIAPRESGPIPVRRCPRCGLCVHLAVKVCPECEFTLRESVLTEEPSGVLVEVIREERGPKTLTLNGRTHTIREWAEARGLDVVTIYTRLARGLSTEEVLAPARRMITARGKTQDVSAWAQELGVDRKSIAARLRRGASDEEALLVTHNEPLRTITYRGETRTVAAWSTITGISKNTLKTRLRRGATPEKILAPWSDNTTEQAPKRLRRRAGEGSIQQLPSGRFRLLLSRADGTRGGEIYASREEAERAQALLQQTSKENAA